MWRAAEVCTTHTSALQQQAGPWNAPDRSAKVPELQALPAAFIAVLQAQLRDFEEGVSLTSVS